ncbi:uncharacterized protein STEHIDRAFT_109572 [Stereum hirsutum FP-91666 SS1]|uniref:uncharacterized protein n=1 Tax=Stereum hirsutum (strain FP-91666) TaxID=721885 RepID=UPI000440E706|nr:uncharacterized protein STEHIDRAFT_109572 [Stereum hirsutum FP-91666 SS1]EIM89375.1 hypothetical protein STEHIDRAFT_109572 [Stereum hirsutum FP-91666 SS1]
MASSCLYPYPRIPDDILRLIFHDVAPLAAAAEIPVSIDGHWQTYQRTSDINDIRSLIHVSQVCQQWRAVALGAANLWSNIWVENDHWRYEMLTRTRDAPLMLIHLDDKKGISAMMPLISLLHRVKYLRLRVKRGDTPTLFNGPFSHSAPLLETFSLKLCNPSPVLDIPRNLFASDTPRLRSLCIEGRLSSKNLLQSRILDNLTELRLSRPGCSTGLDIVWSAIYRIRNRLETLVLHNVLPYFSSDPSWPLDAGRASVIDLPKLTHLEISAQSHACASFTKQLKISPHAKVFYAITHTEDVDGRAVAEYFPSMLHPIPRMSTIQLRSLFFSVGCAEDYPDVPVFKCGAGRLVGPLRDEPKSFATGTQLTIHFDLVDLAPAEDEFTIVYAICHCLYLDSVQDVVLQQVGLAEPNRWIKLLGRLTGVERLVLRSKESLPILALLAGVLSSSAASEEWLETFGATCPLPRLTTLYLLSWDFRETHVGNPLPLESMNAATVIVGDEDLLGEGEGEVGIPALLLDVLRRLASQSDPPHHRTGGGLAELQFVDCHITETQVQAFEGVVSKVCLDGEVSD